MRKLILSAILAAMVIAIIARFSKMASFLTLNRDLDHSATGIPSRPVSLTQKKVSERRPPIETQTPGVNKSEPAVNKSEIDLAVGNVAIPLIADSSGRRTGRNLATEEPYQEIPQSTYFEDAAEDESKTPPTKEITHFVQITQPQPGKYSVVLTGLAEGEYKLSIRAFSVDGTSQPAIVETGQLKPRAQVKFELNYTSASTDTSSITKTSN